MNIAVNSPVAIDRADTTLPILACTGPLAIAIRAGTIVTAADRRAVFETDTPIDLDKPGIGQDYGIRLADNGSVEAVPISAGFDRDQIFAGFHIASFANATARGGGTLGRTINPYSCWDIGFRPACPDPRGMTLVDGRFWADIYLLGVDHDRDGTSLYAATIADGAKLPNLPAGGKAKKLDYATAQAIYAHHGKHLLGAEEFFAAAYGVEERCSRDEEPDVTGEAAGARFVSKWGLIDATGTMWQWGTDGDPDNPRASFFGGTWWDGGSAGSRCADLGGWPVYSVRSISARGRCGHMRPE
jgi:hypothetical protein